MFVFILTLFCSSTFTYIHGSDFSRKAVLCHFIQKHLDKILSREAEEF